MQASVPGVVLSLIRSKLRRCTVNKKRFRTGSRFTPIGTDASRSVPNWGASSLGMPSKIVSASRASHSGQPSSVGKREWSYESRVQPTKQPRPSIKPLPWITSSAERCAAKRAMYLALTKGSPWYESKGAARVFICTFKFYGDG